MAREISIPALREVAENLSADRSTLDALYDELTEKIDVLDAKASVLRVERNKIMLDQLRAADAEAHAWDAVTDAENAAYDAYTEAMMDLEYERRDLDND